MEDELEEVVSPLAMSDEDFLASPPPVVTQDETVDTAHPVETDVVDVVDVEEEETVIPVVEDDKANQDVEPTVDTEVKTAPTKAAPLVEKGQPVKADKPADAADEKVEAPDYKALYESLMAPLKANGKNIELRKPEELLQLAQMGANYTSKMQAIAPHRKVLLMLEQNGLLDEGKLSYLIDLDKKNPQAIAKLVKDSGIDPLDMDVSAESTYREGNHRVTDDETNFHTALGELSSTQDGRATLQAINTWDHASKELLLKESGIMATIHEQRSNGIYDRIVEEVDRQRMLGAIPASTSFLHAYKAVGDFLDSTGSFADLVKPTIPAVKAPVATRPVVPKSVLANGEKATAAATTASSPRKASVLINPLAMSDDDFLKQMANRL